MTKRALTRAAFDEEHRALLISYHRARGGDRLKALAKLKAFVTARLKAGK